MRYGNPSIKSRIDALTAQGCDRILVMPLYPQYSASTSATVVDKVAAALKDMRAQPTVRFTPPYYDDPSYIDALAVSIDRHLATLSYKPETIVASFHGMPQSYIDKGDPYQAQCVATVNALRARMGLDEKGLMAHLPVAVRYAAGCSPIPPRLSNSLRRTVCGELPL